MEYSKSVSFISGITSDCSVEEHFPSEYIPSESKSNSENISESAISEIIPVIINREVGFLKLIN